jgi:hypothetical protein
MSDHASIKRWLVGLDHPTGSGQANEKKSEELFSFPALLTSRRAAFHPDFHSERSERQPWLRPELSDAIEPMAQGMAISRMENELVQVSTTS